MAVTNKSVPAGDMTEPTNLEVLRFMLKEHEETAAYYKREAHHYHHQWCTGSFGPETKEKGEANRKLWMMHELSANFCKKLIKSMEIMGV